MRSILAANPSVGYEMNSSYNPNAEGATSEAAQNDNGSFQTDSLLSNDRNDSPDQAIRTSDFDQFGNVTLNVDTTTGPDVWNGEAFTLRVKFSLPYGSKECCTGNSVYDNDARVTKNSIFVLAEKRISETRVRSGVEFSVTKLNAYADITLRMPRDTEGTSNKIRLVVAGTLKTWRPDAT